jgi:hypothetical protein
MGWDDEAARQLGQRNEFLNPASEGETWFTVCLAFSCYRAQDMSIAKAMNCKNEF